MINKVKTKVLIVHGYTSHCNAEWFPWLKEQLEREGVTVIVPEMPNSDDPELSSWLQCLEENMPGIDENTLLIGHSLGCITVLRYLLLKKVRVKGLLLVSGFIDRNPMRIQTENLTGFTKGYLDIDEIRKLAPYRMTVSARDDDIVPSKATVEMAEKLQTELLLLNNGKHFIARDGYTKFPSLYMLIKQILK